MADVFGDLSLFSEFERDREAEGSFIRYDESSKGSRIIFEGFASDEDSESETEYDGHQEAVEEDGEKGDENESKKDKATNVKGQPNGKSTSSKSENPEDIDKETAWLNEQLYADAEEEASGSSVSINQLMFDKNKYERFCKIIDSTRFVPDEDSPPVQILFHNSIFARRYRQQIEQFIKSLLWDYANNKDHKAIQEVTVKPGTPSGMDINKKLTPDQRYERMRQKHALIGSCQFHNCFLVDFLGWPFSVGEPTRCNENWEVPVYSQVFNEVYADPSNKGKTTQQQKKKKPACWNCGTENHSVAECRLPRNPARIAAKRKEFLEEKQQQDNQPKFTGAKRYHLDPEIASKFNKFQAGHISANLREALGLRDDQLPQHIYKMRLFGYPPGWLEAARQNQSSVNIFDKHGRVALITGECLEDGELDEEDKEGSEYDINKIVEFPGFTVPVPLGIVDEHANFQMPPIQQHQLKKTLMDQSADKKLAKKRKRTAAREEKKAEENAKRAKTSTEGDGEDGEIKDEDAGTSDTQPADAEVDEEKDESKDDEQTTPIPAMNRSSSTISISRDFGTPILVREKTDLPDASKFGVGIEDHIPFENLPDSVGMFAKMRDLIDGIRKKKSDSS